jgi:hypothetical protein
MMQAHTTTASVALPANDKPSGAGISHKIKKNAIHARKNPTIDTTGLWPVAKMLYLNRPKNPTRVDSLIVSPFRFIYLNNFIGD